jgi:Nif-specific regulatory protein
VNAGHLPRVRRVGPRAAAADASAGPGPGAGAGPGPGLAIPLGLTLDEATRRYVAATVEACDGNKAEAARRLDVGRNTIGRTLKGEGPADD